MPPKPAAPAPTLLPAPAIRATITLAAALALASLLTAAPAPAAATPVSYSFAGQVDFDEAERGWDRFGGSFRFDSSTPDGIADTSTGAYAHAGAPWGMTLDFYAGDVLAQTVTIDALFNVLVGNDLGGEDQFGLLAQDSDPAHAISMTLYDFSATVFASDALPLPAGGLTLAMFSWSDLHYESSEGALFGRLDALACTLGCTPDGGSGTPPPPPPPAVPEPGTWALVLGGLAAMTGLRRRRPTA